MAAVALILFAVALVYVVVPLLVALVDLLILILVALLGALTRVLFRRPWTVEARAADGTTQHWRVTGWRASHERCIEIAQRLQAGIEPDPSPGAAPSPP